MNLLSFKNSKNTRNELAHPVMRTIFLVIECRVRVRVRVQVRVGVQVRVELFLLFLAEFLFSFVQAHVNLQNG